MVVRCLTIAAAIVLLPLFAAAQPPPLRVVAPFEITSLEPSRAGYNFTRMQVAETLLGAGDGGLPEPGLATAWVVSDDRLSWRLTLRDGATFHDGTPVTAEAVVAALVRARGQPGPLADAPIVAIETGDARTVVIRTSTPFTPLLAYLAESSTLILAPSSWDNAGEVAGSGAGTVRRVVGSGPYRITSIQPPLRFEVERFDAWNGGPKPMVERAVFQAVPRAETRALMAESGQADLAFTLDPAGTDRLRRAPRTEMRVMAIPRTQTLKLNAGGAYFSDVRVRRAVSLAVNRDGIARAILRSPESSATQMFPPALAEWHVPALSPLRQDVAEARRLLAEAGWTAGADGILQREGRAFRPTLRTFSVRPELPVVAAALQEALREVGIDLQVAIVPAGDIPAGHRDGTLDAALMARNFSLVPDPIGTLLSDYGPRGGDWGAMGWSSPELVDALTRLGQVTDPLERAALRARISTVLQAELPVVPIAWYDHRVAVSRRLADVSVDPLELSYRISRIRWAE